MGFAPRSPRRAVGVDSADHDGDARLRRSEGCRSAAEAEAELLSREPSLQQLVMHVEGCAPARVGVPGALGEQADWCARFGGALSGADESIERARFADMARLSVAHTAAGALRVHGFLTVSSPDWPRRAITKGIESLRAFRHLR
jgi:hypothetical protein